MFVSAFAYEQLHDTCLSFFLRERETETDTRGEGGEVMSLHARGGIFCLKELSCDPPRSWRI